MARPLLPPALAVLALAFAAAPAAALDDLPPAPVEVEVILLSPDPADSRTLSGARALLDLLAADRLVRFASPTHDQTVYQPCAPLEREARIACVRARLPAAETASAPVVLIAEMGRKVNLDWNIDCVGRDPERDVATDLVFEHGLQVWPRNPDLHTRTRAEVAACLLGAAGVAVPDQVRD